MSTVPKAEQRDRITVIVPVYNCARYVSRCIESITAQTYRLLEIILINDGSTDNSGDLCDSYARRDCRITAVHNRNAGPAAARNAGLDRATGDLILFVDSDDYLEQNAVELLVAAYRETGADLIIGDSNAMASSQVSHGFKGSFTKSRLLTRDDLAQYIRSYLKRPNKSCLFGYSWARLFKASIIRAHNLRFDPSLHTYEDVAFNAEYLRFTSSAYFLKVQLYNYTVNGYGSATMNITEGPEKMLGYGAALAAIRRFLEECEVEADIEAEVGHAYVSLSIIQLVRICGQLTLDNRRKILGLVRQLAKHDATVRSLPHYSPSQGDSRMVPKLLRLGVAWPIAVACLYKSRKRYKKEIRNSMATVSYIAESEAVDSLRGSNLPVIIFGAGIVGEVLLNACRDKGIAVECFCDNNVHIDLPGVRVLQPKHLPAQFPDAVFLISTADIRDAVDQLAQLGYRNWHPSSAVLRDYDLGRHEYNAAPDFVRYAVETCILCQDSFSIPGRCFLRSVDVIITERCSMKCRDCSNLMQYYAQPTDCEPADVLASVDALCRAVDGINEFRVIGGEPFMNRQFPKIVNRLTAEPKAKKVVIYTNGTIVPRDEGLECLKHPNVLVYVTDYGSLSRNLAKLVQVCEQNGVSFHINKANGWTDCGSIQKHSRTVEQAREVFRTCCAKNTITLSDGRLYRCPFDANAVRLRAIPDFPGDYVDVKHDPQDVDAAMAIKQRIRNLCWDKSYLEACDYCAGRAFDAPEIVPAIQIKKALEYVSLV